MDNITLIFLDGTQETYHRMEFELAGIGLNLSEDVVKDAIQQGKTFTVTRDGHRDFINSNTVKKYFFDDGNPPPKDDKGGCGVWCPGCSKCGY